MRILIRYQVGGSGYTDIRVLLLKLCLRRKCIDGHKRRLRLCIKAWPGKKFLLQCTSGFYITEVIIRCFNVFHNVASHINTPFNININ